MRALLVLAALFLLLPGTAFAVTGDWLTDADAALAAARAAKKPILAVAMDHG